MLIDLLRAALLGLFRQDLSRGTGAGVVASRAATASGSGIADHPINNQPYNDSKNNADNNRRNHLILSPLLLPASTVCQPSVMVGR